MIFNTLGRHSDALAILKKMLLRDGDNAAYQLAEIYAQFNRQTQSDCVAGEGTCDSGRRVSCR